MNPIIFKKNPDVFDFKDNFELVTTRIVNILFVVDTAVKFDPNSGFGVGRVIRLLHNKRLGCLKFKVAVARRNLQLRGGGTPPIVINQNPSPSQPKYENFHFDDKENRQLILEQYHEVFLFGFAPDNSGGSDSNISAHPWYTTDNELKVLEDWMNRGGGVFATGDHDYLGASMCHRIPRVGTMRKWTNADNVPPIDGDDRIDTNVPPTPDLANGIGTISTSVERDNIPQRIDWVPVRTIRNRFRQTTFPHEILCHPTRGIINVMPDHPHEGCCNEINDIDLNAKVKFGNTPEYPVVDGFQAKPKVIAYGNVIARSNHGKGPVNARRFPMISVYDGREKNTLKVGRVVVDSTWHHWMNLNITDFENDPDPTNWEKISRYYINIAKWLAPKYTGRNLCYLEIFKQPFVYPALREVNRKTPLFEVGSIVKSNLISVYGKCSVTKFIFEPICRFRPSICRFYEGIDLEPGKIDPLCLSCPPFDILEDVILGAMYRSIEPMADDIKQVLIEFDSEKEIEIDIDTIKKLSLQGFEKGLDFFQNELQNSCEEINSVFQGK